MSVDDTRIFLLASGLPMLGFIRASADLFGTISAPDRFSLGQLREILWLHMLNIQGLEEAENLLHPFFFSLKVVWKRKAGQSLLYKFHASQGEMQAHFLQPDLHGWSPFCL